MLLYNELNDKLKLDRDFLVACFIKGKDLKVKRVTYFYDNEYGSGVNAYICKAEEGISPIQAFMGLWLKNTIWEEEVAGFTYTKEECEKIYDEIFSYVVEDYNLETLDNLKAKQYMAKKINLELKNIAKLNLNIEEGKIRQIPFLDISGVYVNKRYSNKKVSIMNKDDDVVDNVQLCHNDMFNEYRELFIQTKERYIYFF